MRLGADFFARPVVALAQRLIGCVLLVDGVGGVIVETEAYDRDDPASHSFGGPGKRNAAMFGPPGRAYVYRSYGLHWCLNLVGGERSGAAVLIRALEPTHGLERMAMRRGTDNRRLLCAGPGRLTQALGVTDALDGAALDDRLELFSADPGGTVAAGPRVGISKAVDLPWRFGLAGSPFLSRPIGRGFSDQAVAPTTPARPTGFSSPRE